MLFYNTLMENLVEINDLFVEYETKKEVFKSARHVYAINGINLNIKKGEILAVAGESGCGKSTLAKTLLRLVKPKSGEIFYKERDIFKMNSKLQKSYCQNVSMVFQNPYASLNPKMTVFDIVKEPLLVHSNLRNFSSDLKTIKELSKNELKEIVLDIIRQVGLDECDLEKYPHEFSGGQRQRIAIARALLLNTEVLLFDEATSNLDNETQAKIQTAIDNLKGKYTILIIAHRLSTVINTNKIYVINKGTVEAVGTHQELLKTSKTYKKLYRKEDNKK